MFLYPRLFKNLSKPLNFSLPWITGSSSPAIKNIGKAVFFGLQSLPLYADFNNLKRLIKAFVVNIKPQSGSASYASTVSGLAQIQSSLLSYPLLYWPTDKEFKNLLGLYLP